MSKPAMPRTRAKNPVSPKPSSATIADCERRFDEIGRRWIDDGAQSRRSDLPDLVYHYTDAAGLAGMLGSDEIWLTDSRFLNDKTEGVHLLQSVGEILIEMTGGASDDRLKRLYSVLGSIIPTNPGSNLFIFSTSERSDDLSQWRGYAREGRGFTIGLDARRLYETSLPQDSSFNFSKVEYDHQKQRRVSERIIAEIGGRLLEEIARNPHLDAEDITIEAARTLSWTIRNRRGFSKHKSFEAEAEWRISAVEDQNADEILVRTSGFGLVPYIALKSFGPAAKLPIVTLGIGPGFENSEIADAVSALCRKNGYEPDIWFADTPYRRP